MTAASAKPPTTPKAATTNQNVKPTAPKPVTSAPAAPKPVVKNGELAVARDTSVVMTGRDAARLTTTIGMLGAPFYHARASGDVGGGVGDAGYRVDRRVELGGFLGERATGDEATCASGNRLPN